MAAKFDRSAEDLGNIVALEHVNFCIPDQRISTLFYVTGLGLTRDPYLVTGVTNMWINVGRSQFHLPTGDPMVLRGRVGLVLPDLDALAERLESVREPLADTQFGFAPANARDNGHIDVTGPWGNRFRCHEPGTAFGRMALGMPYVELEVPTGAAFGIAEFYREIFGAHTDVDPSGDTLAARVMVGNGQYLVFRETDAEAPEFDGHHIQIYVSDFSGPHGRLNERGLISQEDNQHQYRFKDIVDAETGDVLFTLEHEVRSMTHPLYARPLVNRNPDEDNRNFSPGHQETPWALPYAG